MCTWILLIAVIVQPGTCFGEIKHNQSLQFSPRDGKGWGWDSDKSTFFDIALTALAFLSFGVFLLNLLLNALLYPTPGTGLTQPAGPILTMITSGSTGGAIVTGTGLGRRLRRASRQPFMPELDEVTAARSLVKFVITSIEMMKEKHECLPKIICEGSRKASLMGSRYRLLFSVISVSTSYLGKVIGINDDLPTHLKAMMLGARNRNCQTAFPSCKRR